jgi:hypothetical protein
MTLLTLAMLFVLSLQVTSPKADSNRGATWIVPDKIAVTGMKKGNEEARNVQVLFDGKANTHWSILDGASTFGQLELRFTGLNLIKGISFHAIPSFQKGHISSEAVPVARVRLVAQGRPQETFLLYHKSTPQYFELKRPFIADNLALAFSSPSPRSKSNTRAAAVNISEIKILGLVY